MVSFTWDWFEQVLKNYRGYRAIFSKSKSYTSRPKQLGKCHFLLTDRVAQPEGLGFQNRSLSKDQTLNL